MIVKDRDSKRYGYIKNHMKTVKNKQAQTRERKSEQKPEVKPGKSSLITFCGEAPDIWSRSRKSLIAVVFQGLEGYYRRFIANSSKVAKPLASLTQNNRKLEWAKEQKESFQTIRLCTHAKRQGRERDSRNAAWPGPTNGKEGRWRSG
ncbi:hypothetical protein Tco_0614453 [Tanacetum coccineum]